MAAVLEKYGRKIVGLITEVIFIIFFLVISIDDGSNITPCARLFFPLSEFANMHPFQPNDQCEGYREMIDTLDAALCEITQFAAVSTQPNSGCHCNLSC